MYVSFSTINRWENGHRIPKKLTIMCLIKFCRKYAVDRAIIYELERLYRGIVHGCVVYEKILDVLLSVRAPVGDLNMACERCCIGRGPGAIHSKNG